MKLHDLRPAPGSRKDRTRVGRGISAGKGKTAGRGTKGQKSRAGASIPAWFEGGQTPLHIRVPKLRGFKRRDRVEYQVVNVGRISAYASAGRFGIDADDAAGGRDGAGDAPVTVNAQVLRRAGLVGSDRHPVKILGNGEVTEKLFVAADAFTRSARSKIEDAGGFVQLLAPEREAQDATATEADARQGSPEAPGTVAEAAELGEATEATEVTTGPAETAEPAGEVTATASEPASTDARPVRRKRRTAPESAGE